jgi:hypothetical protein
MEHTRRIPGGGERERSTGLRRRNKVVNFGYVRMIGLPRGSAGEGKFVIARRDAPNDALCRRMIKPISFVGRSRAEINAFFGEIPCVAGGIFLIGHNSNEGNTTEGM